MFRIENNVPDTYIKGSRDFQLISRLYTAVYAGNRFDSSTIVNILDPMQINDRMLDLYATKVGFFTAEDIDSKILRVILKSFPYVIKYKGSLKGIEEATYTILKAEKKYAKPSVVLDPETSTINIYTSSPIINKKALKIFLEYVMPIGYTYSIQEAQNESTNDTLMRSGKVSTLVNPIISMSQIYNPDRISSGLDIYEETGARVFTSSIENQLYYTLTASTSTHIPDSVPGNYILKDNEILNLYILKNDYYELIYTAYPGTQISVTNSGGNDLTGTGLNSSIVEDVPSMTLTIYENYTMVAKNASTLGIAQIVGGESDLTSNEYTSINNISTDEIYTNTKGKVYEYPAEEGDTPLYPEDIDYVKEKTNNE